MLKKFTLYISLMMCILAVSLSAHAATDKAGDMAAGTWPTNPRFMTFGRYNNHPLVWRVLEVKDNDSDFNGVKTAFLLLDDLLRDNNGNVEMSVYDSTSNSYPKSKIKEWLNDAAGGFLSCLNAYNADILDTTYNPDNPPRKWSGSPASGTSKVFLLGVGEANKSSYFANNTDRAVANTSWWLRSPGYENDIASVVFNIGGATKNGIYVDSLSAVRPAIKVNLSPSSSFATISISYGLTIKTEAGGSPIAGVKTSLSPSGEAQSVEKFSNSSGLARFACVIPGEYTVTFTKPGFVTKSENITVSEAITYSISLESDPAALPDKVKFGKYENKPIVWDALDIINDRVLLLAGALFERHFDTKNSNIWSTSTLRVYMNSNIKGGFLEESNFTKAEAAAIDAAASATKDAVSLLSIQEIESYLPDANMRYYDDKTWLTRTPYGDEYVESISPDGEFCAGGVPVFDRGIAGWSRPAIWVDLNKATYESSTNTLVASQEKPKTDP